jgi:hypothetical protein
MKHVRRERDLPHPAVLAPKPEGRYSKTANDRSLESLLADYIADTLAEAPDEWDEITATETPRAIGVEPTGKRSGVYVRGTTQGEELQALRVRCSGGDP